jgi:hypothetical protein
MALTLAILGLLASADSPDGVRWSFGRRDRGPTELEMARVVADV